MNPIYSSQKQPLLFL